ncbi:phytanoyl-CoA dioxygenase family protein [Acidisoma cellulosilytica]|uniref:Phytanoyl-CoA dioxygenase family protein n=1 Tax=Acidisoma cellulosilyticum TaxID=2802395 RepID=A0A964E3Z4_9PROT|nr:phytanoyl-CoA dioxygenase family protein [Acidisoma cellulosilyticum]MCB8881160.1 phytanoyl-CoA dioxygenase family protein [Acidisoma cellulosilyticum]
MKSDNLTKLRADRIYLSPERVWLEEFARISETETRLEDYPLAAEVASRVLIYDCDQVRRTAATDEGRRAVLAEWAEALLSGPGIIVLRRAFADTAPIDAASDVFRAIIAEQHENNTGGGDHFAKPGANDRIWNALEKLCLRAPDVFAGYYGNEILAMVSEAWLGPAYQFTSQVNVVNPGGEAQSAHRDYHLGFMTPAQMAQYPAHVHRLSPALTLQGAVAHCDMPVETGPTLYLPYSQSYEPGYLAITTPEFRAYFEQHHVQLPLEKGDAAFFNPALFHAAGTNRSKDIRRMANLLQVSSAFGRAMESMDRTRMSTVLYPVLQDMRGSGQITEAQALDAIAACAEGYPFPTNLDRDPPVGGLAPKSQHTLMREAFLAGEPDGAFSAGLKAQAEKRLT